MNVHSLEIGKIKYKDTKAKILSSFFTENIYAQFYKNQSKKTFVSSTEVQPTGTASRLKSLVLYGLNFFVL